MAHTASLAHGRCCHTQTSTVATHASLSIPVVVTRLAQPFSRHFLEGRSRQQGGARRTITHATELVSSEDLGDGSTLFHFGDESSPSASEDAQKLAQQEKQVVPSMPASPSSQQRKQSKPEVDKKKLASVNSTKAQQPKQTNQVVTSSSEGLADAEASDSDSPLANLTPDKLEQMKVSELRDLCKQEHVKGYSKLKKDELVSILQKQLRS